MKQSPFCLHSLATFALVFLAVTLATAQRPAARITQQIDASRRVTLHGNTLPLARAEFDRGAAPASMVADRMMLLLSRSNEQEKALRQLLDDQQTAGSPNFHKWLTPEEFGRQFGPSDSDIQTVTTWLLNNGFQVTNVSPGKNVIEFSGTVAQLQQVFHTELHKYVVDGQEYWANSSDPQIPTALAPVVQGIVSLNNFGRRAQSHSVQPFKRNVLTGEASPLITTGGSPAYYLLGPGDFSVIYNSSPLIQTGNDGSGQKIAIAGRTNINLQDVTDFRNFFGLPNFPDNHTTVILNGPDPGILNGDETEALLDVEWAGAVAPGASVVLVASESTLTGDGLDLSALYIVQNNLAPVMSVSYGNCEANLGNAGNLFYQSLWEQAAAQGITVTVAAGDNGSAGCDNPNSVSVAQRGIAVNGLASTPFNIAVGGTDFNDSATQTTYFNSFNAAGSWTSAKSYVPEMPWNDSCAGGASPNTGSCSSGSKLQLWSGSGGPSNCSSTSGGTCSGTAKPSWQSGTGVPNDGVRNLPDISLFAASGESGSHSLYVICEADFFPGSPSCQNPGPNGGNAYLVAIAGTSAASPAFAGAVALANQKAGHRLGNLNYLLYSIAAQAGATCPSASNTPTCVFHDVTIGSNSVPCKGGTPQCSATNSSQTGVLVDSGKLAYLSGTGYDRATGLGTPNINNLVTKIVAASFTPTATALTLNGATALVNASHSQGINVAVSVSPSAATGDVSLIGNDGTADISGIDSSKLTAGAAGWSSNLFPGGTYTVHAHYAGDGSRGASDSNAVSVNIGPEDSKTFVNLVTFNLSGNLTSFTATGAEYGSPYILRMDVGDAAATVSSSTGISSRCVNGTASCPTGTLTVIANGSPLDGGSWKLNNLGHSEDQPIQLAPGTYSIVATYPGDASYNASSGSTNINIGKAGTTVVAGVPAPVKYAAATSVTAEVDSNSNGVPPSGTVSFTENGSPLNVYNLGYQGTPGGASGFARMNANGTFNFLSLGSHNVTAQYAGDGNYSSSTSQVLTFNVVQDDTRIASIGYGGSFTTGSAATITASVVTDGAGVEPTGTVTFYDGTTAMNGTVTYSGHDGTQFTSAELDANLTYTFSTAGTHQITVKYSGDTYYLPSDSGTAQSVQVTGPFNIVPAGPITVTAGQTGNTTLTLSSNNGFTGSVTLTCAPGASAAETACGFAQGSAAAQSSVVVDLNGTDVPVTFTVTTTAAHSIAANRPLIFRNIAGGLMVCGLFVFGIPRLRRKSAALLTVLLLLSILPAVSCGGGGGNSTPPPRTDPGTTRGTYTFSVTGTTGSGANVVTVPAQVTVAVN